jgi:peroxin-4
MSSIQQLLAYPEPDSPLNIDIALLLREGDLVGAEALVRYYTEENRWSGI